jgi:hypothetical protein
MTYSSVAGSALEIPADLMRLSVGLETSEDPLEDPRAALAGQLPGAGARIPPRPACARPAIAGCPRS